MSILDNIADRADWFATVSATIIQLQRLETLISIAMLDRPTSSAAIQLMIADQQLGLATRALTEAAAQIRGMR